ncbi:MAG: threonine synthase [Balneolaceae bacterium]
MVQYISTNGESDPVSFRKAMQQGLAPDGGLYMPDKIPRLPRRFWDAVDTYSLQEIAVEVSRQFIGDELSKDSIRELADQALDFDAPLVHLYEQVWLLELFHGPTLAFKDFGARFMAQAFARLDEENGRDLLILVATSGDTGSAVANGFYGVPGTRVCLLYPSGKVSSLQEKQMTTLGGNVTALEVNGTFDDCQKLVKTAFGDDKLKNVLRLSSANSINIARLLPQSFYYISAYGQIRGKTGSAGSPVYSVPSGNFGNLTAGILAMKMGLPAERFLAATNRNDVVPEYLDSGKFKPRPSVQTISNAMDVGNPSNFDRLKYLFGGSAEEIRKVVWGKSFDDRVTRSCIRKVYEQTGKVVDPHTAVGILAADTYRKESGTGEPVIVLSTAHPSKFADIVEQETGRPVEIPDSLKACLGREKKSIAVEKDYESFKSFLIEKFKS